MIALPDGGLRYTTSIHPLPLTWPTLESDRALTLKDALMRIGCEKPVWLNLGG